MAVIGTLTAEEQKGFDEWVAGRPPVIQEMIAKHPINRLYRMASTGHRVFIIAYDEGGTVRVAVTGRFNAVMFERQVFGVDPKTLVECDLPGPGEPVGAVLTEQADIDAYIEKTRPFIMKRRAQQEN